MRILLVCDHQPLCQALRPCLEREGHVVSLATNAREATVQIQRGTCDVILLALLFALETGLALLRHWRQQGLGMHLLMILYGNKPRDRVRCLELGADGYLTLPLHIEELLARLSYLTRRREARDPLLRIYDLEINQNDGSVRRRGQPIHLTPREFALLQLLALNRGRVVSRAMIWDHLYGQDDTNNSNVIDVYIRYLRLKIDKGFDPPLILTRWGKGYLMRGEQAWVGEAVGAVQRPA
jgi:DNA-binding response OmpR family regulator